MDTKIDTTKVLALQEFSRRREADLFARYGSDSRSRTNDLVQVMVRAGEEVFEDPSGDALLAALDALGAIGQQPIDLADLDVAPLDDPAPSEAYTPYELERARTAFLSASTDGAQRALILRAIDKETWKAIGEDLGVTANTAKTKAQQAATALTQELLGGHLVGCDEFARELPKVIYGITGDRVRAREKQKIEDCVAHLDECPECDRVFVRVRRALEVGAALLPPLERDHYEAPEAIEDLAADEFASQQDDSAGADFEDPAGEQLGEDGDFKITLGEYDFEIDQEPQDASMIVLAAEDFEQDSGEPLFAPAAPAREHVSGNENDGQASVSAAVYPSEEQSAGVRRRANPLTSWDDFDGSWEQPATAADLVDDELPIAAGAGAPPRAARSQNDEGNRRLLRDVQTAANLTSVEDAKNPALPANSESAALDAKTLAAAIAEALEQRDLQRQERSAEEPAVEPVASLSQSKPEPQQELPPEIYDAQERQEDLFAEQEEVPVNSAPREEPAEVVAIAPVAASDGPALHVVEGSAEGGQPPAASAAEETSAATESRGENVSVLARKQGQEKDFVRPRGVIRPDSTVPGVRVFLTTSGGEPEETPADSRSDRWTLLEDEQAGKEDKSTKRRSLLAIAAALLIALVLAGSALSPFGKDTQAPAPVASAPAKAAPEKAKKAKKAKRAKKAKKKSPSQVRYQQPAPPAPTYQAPSTPAPSNNDQNVDDGSAEFAPGV